MGLSGFVAARMDEAIERRLREQIRRQQEQQAAAQLALQVRQQEALEADRRADLDYRQGQVARQDADALQGRLAPGPITPEQAGVLRKSPQTAGMVTPRKILEGVRPIVPGMSQMDASGPQDFSVLEPTQAQAEGAYKKTRLKEIGGLFSRASNEQERRSVAARALEDGIELPSNLLGQTGAEKTAQELAAELRDRNEWNRRNAITESNIRTRPSKGGLADMSPAEVSAVFKLQDDFARDSKPFVLMRDAYQRVSTASKNPDAAGDLSLIFGYMKILDPNSVVREAEFANAQNAAGVPDQIRNLYNRAISGERLNPEQRKQFVSRANELFGEAKRNQAQVMRQYTTRAAKLRLDPSMVVEDLDTGVGDAGGDGAAEMVEAIDAQGNRHRAPKGTPLPPGWKWAQ